MSLERIGKYRIVAKVGEGAMGEVYKAHDPLLNRFVALKTIAPSLAADDQFRERFKREAQSAAGLNHPNIITVYDFGEESGVTFLAMEFLEGTDLREAIRNHSLGHLGRKIEVMEQLCEGIGFAHSRGTFHRDLKPGNIYIQPSGHVKVLDFGLAKLAASEMTRTGTVMGTPTYMAPEQLRGQKVDARADVFALGAIFYELLAGTRAFEGQMHEVMQRFRDPVPLRQRAPATPIALANLVEKAMSREPEARFKDAAEMGRAVVAAREELAGETLASPVAREDTAERTLLQSAGATLLEPPPRRSTVHGTAALDVSRHHEPPQRTVRPEMTMSSGPATEVGRRWPPFVLGGVLAVVVAGVGGFLLLRSRQTTAPEVVGPTAESDQLGALTEVIVIGKLELARTDLENRGYASAAASAQEALKLDPANAEAKAILEQAERAQRELDAAVAEARAAAGRGDTQRAKAALSQVLQLDPSHPVAGELQASLNQAFRQEADEARRQSAQAQAAADKARATTQPAYAAARTLAAQGETAFGRQEYTPAAQNFLRAKAGFENAQRTADAARAAEAAQRATAEAAARAAAEAATRAPAAPTPRPTSIATAPPPTQAPVAAATATPPLPQPSLVPPPRVAVPTPTAASLPTPSAAPSATADPGDAAVRRVLAEYERAIEGQDIALFRSLKPGLSSDEEKRLRDAFKAVKSQDVGIAVESVQIEGDHATVRVRRQDTINGRKLTATQQTWRLARSGGAWQIVAIDSR
jgi:serine/threonine-protein kinase